MRRSANILWGLDRGGVDESEGPASAGGTELSGGGSDPQLRTIAMTPRDDRTCDQHYGPGIDFDKWSVNSRKARARVLGSPLDAEHSEIGSDRSCRLSTVDCRLPPQFTYSARSRSAGLVAATLAVSNEMMFA